MNTMSASLEPIDSLDYSVRGEINGDFNGYSGGSVIQAGPTPTPTPTAKKRRLETETSLGRHSHRPGQLLPGNTLRMPPTTSYGFKVAHRHNERERPLIDLNSNCREPTFVALPTGFVPTWKQLLPTTLEVPPQSRGLPKTKAFQLTLLNVSEFTVTGLPPTFDSQPTSVSGLRSHIKHISRSHGKAVWERDSASGDGKWRIPLGAYHAFHAFLTSDPMTTVDPIPQLQLKIASIGHARLEKGHPSVENLILLGVPSGLANALAPYQRSGVEFVADRDGRALIADEMGLGKTVQAIASMSMYAEEWPLLIFCPSAARYHWQNELQNWLGVRSSVNRSSGGDVDEESQSNGLDNCGILHDDSAVHVLSNAKDPILPGPSTRIVVCSYGLAANLIQKGLLSEGQFQCVIVDESHMLKNKATKRTSTILPLLHSASRVILLSGTPAFARPMELWPQLTVLRTERHGWMQDEASFFNDYVTRGTSTKRAQLHTLLTGTIMIRRMKADILKTLPAKIRERAIVEISDVSLRKEFEECMEMLRQGKGAMGRIARDRARRGDSGFLEPQVPPPKLNLQGKERLSRGLEHIKRCFMAFPYNLHETTTDVLIKELENQFDANLELCRDLRGNELTVPSGISSQAASEPDPPQWSSNFGEPEKKELTRRAVISHMYSLTGKSKVSLVVKMMKRWLNDKTKGKVCIFAHHISVLDALASGAGLSNSKGSTTKFIRIDGSTLPKHRQEQINAFQNDPSIRIALLGITAAGVAVTLTASSTVWFTELFWTPALMIQAEDRCHRIGQQAQVRCLYFVAKGTIDEILWELISKKFQNLGEFVEGKEKMKMIVHRTFAEHELLSSSGDGYDSEDEESCTNDDTKTCPSELGGILAEVSVGLRNDIEELKKTEEMMVRSLDSDDEADSSVNIASKSNNNLEASESAAQMGQTESAAICLDDDEDEDDSLTKPFSSQGNGHSGRGFRPSSHQLAQWRLYKLRVRGPKLGLKITTCKGRIIVKAIDSSRVQEYGATAKPNIGDIIVAVNGLPLPLFASTLQVVQLLQLAITNPPTEIIFAEDLGLTEHVKKQIASK